jgi:hypothetical protein
VEAQVKDLLAGAPTVFGVRTGRSDAGSFYDFAHQTADGHGYASAGFLVGVGTAGGSGTGEGKTVAINATTLEAAMRSIVRRDERNEPHPNVVYAT